MKVLLVTFLIAQIAWAKPGMGGWMTPPGGSWAGWGMSLGGLGGPGAALGAGGAPAGPWGNWGLGGSGAAGPNPLAIGATYKQLGLNQAVIKNKIKAAENEIKTHLDALKNTASLVPATDPCGSGASTKAAEIETELLTAFAACEMKNEIQQIRMQSIGVKQQFAAFKMAKKMCKTAVDPVQCLTDATAPTETAEPPVNPIESVSKGLTQVNEKADECIANVKEDLLNKIEEANDQVLLCA